MLGNVRQACCSSGQVRPVYIRLGLFNSCQARLGQVRPGYVRLSQVWKGQAMLGLLVQIKTCKYRL